MNRLTRIEIAAGCQPRLVADLVALQQSAFPPRMQFPNPEEYYRQGLSDRFNINVIARTTEDLIAGYLLAIPQDRVCAELRPWDPAMAENPRTLYIDLIQTLPGRRQTVGVKSLMAGLCREAGERGFDRLSAHVRTTTGLSRVMQRMMMGCCCLRRLDNWFDSGESFDYLESMSRLQGREI